MRLKQIFAMETINWLKFLTKSVLYVMKEIGIMHLDNVVINVFVSNVIKKSDNDILKCVVCKT